MKLTVTTFMTLDGIAHAPRCVRVRTEERTLSDEPGGAISVRNSGRGAAIRTRDLLNPIQVRYQAALRPDGRGF